MSTIRPVVRYFNPYIAWIPLLAVVLMTVQTAVNLDAAAAGSRGGLDFIAPLRGFLWFICVMSAFWLIALCVFTVLALFWGGRAVGDVGWGVLKTYFAGPGAPYWRGQHDEDYVIRIPIPRSLGTLSFNVDFNEASEPAEEDDDRHGMVHLPGFLEQTKEVVGKQLNAILGKIEDHR